jgi:hypothetical protein
MIASAGTGASERGCRVVACFVAFGTRGDVQPLAVLATALATRGAAVTFITHAAHAPLLDAPLRATGIKLVGLRCVACVRMCAARDADV